MIVEYRVKKINVQIATLNNTEGISDGFHTFKELYDIRLAYNSVLFNEWAAQNKYDVHKSKKHNDGLYPFDDPNWFIVVAVLPTGQISNHYTMEHWDKFNCVEEPTAKYPFDGHTTQDVIDRLISLTF
jgi:hypothetical protein